MPEERWVRWAVSIRRRGMGPWVAALLEAGAPLWPLGTILLRAAGVGWSPGTSEAVAWLADPESRRRFVALLTEGEP